MNKLSQIQLGVIGGSGFYKMEGLESVSQIEVETPFGKPSSPVTIGNLEGITVGFIARHGLGHTIHPTEVNYRANIYALKVLGAARVIGISACGSLREDYSPGQIVIPNKLVDFTRKRETSFFQSGLVAHIGVAKPFCPDFSAQLFSSADKTDAPVKFGGTAITIEGPRFSTTAESQLYRSWGIDLIGMTTAPEAFLAREAELCYSALFHVTDYDVWHQTEAPVSVDQVFRIIKQNTDHAQNIIKAVAREFSLDCENECRSALQNAFATNPNAINPDMAKNLAPLVEKYIS